MKKVIVFVLIISCWGTLFADDNSPSVNSFYDLINFYNMQMQKLDIETSKAKAESSKLKAETAKKRAEAERTKAETAKKQAEAERIKAETAKKRAEAERIKAETAKKQAEAERIKAETAKKQAEAERIKAETAKKRAEAAKEQAKKERLKLNVLSEEVIKILIKNYEGLLSELKKANIKWADFSTQKEIKDVLSFIRREKPPKAIEDIITKFELSRDKGAAQIVSMQFCFLALKWERLLKKTDDPAAKEFMQLNIDTIRNLISKHDFNIVKKYYAELDSILGK